MSILDHDSPKSEGSPATPTSRPPSAAPGRTPASGSSSKMATPSPAPPANSRKQSAASRVATQFIGHLPVAREEAVKSFTEIFDNWYQYKSLGRSRELLESMICDCTFDPETDDPEYACGHGSDCINRLTQIECLSGDCRCKAYCQNQRFQKKEYAPIQIVKTEMKGYGLRAEEDLLKDTFIYEYVGDVVSNSSFKKRMRDYANEGIEHFYFMMLQKDEFIDATKHGGIGRFANHSCNPNCYVAKWTIGRNVRMGIFAKRKILKDEELTFNYNVDRYGHQAQTCYCGEPNCVGFIGGKTQTDISSMDDLYLDALGITDDEQLMELKGTKKKKGKKIDDPDFMPTMKPVTEKEVPKVVQAIRQTQSKKILYRLLTRLKITEDQAALRQVMRLRGFSLMKNVLEDYTEDLDIIALALECMFNWPLIARNKVEDSQIATPVKLYMESEDEAVKTWATKLHEHWESLELSYRIPRLKREEPTEEPEEELKGEEIVGLVPGPATHKLRNGRAPRYTTIDLNEEEMRFVEKVRSRHRHPPPAQPLPPPPSPPPSSRPYTPTHADIMHKRKAELEAIIRGARLEKAQALAAAQAKAEAEAKAEEERRLREKAEGGSSNGKKRSRDKEKEKRERKREKSDQGDNDLNKEVLKEKRLMKLISPVVVKSMSKHAGAIGHDKFKKYAKELTEKIAEREKKSSAYRENKLDALSDEKVVKIKKYAKEYIDKVLRKMDKHRGQRNPSSSASGSAGSSATPTVLSPAIGTPTSAMAAVDLEDTMDMDTDSDMEPNKGGDDDMDEDDDGRAGGHDPNASGGEAGGMGPESGMFSTNNDQDIPPKLQVKVEDAMEGVTFKSEDGVSSTQTVQHSPINNDWKKSPSPHELGTPLQTKLKAEDEMLR